MKKTFLCLILAVSVLVLASCVLPEEKKGSLVINNHRATKDFSVGIFDETGTTLLEEYELFTESSITIKLEPGKYVVKFEGRNEGTGYPYPGIDVDFSSGGGFHICFYEEAGILKRQEGAGTQCDH